MVQCQVIKINITQTWNIKSEFSKTHGLEEKYVSNTFKKFYRYRLTFNPRQIQWNLTSIILNYVLVTKLHTILPYKHQPYKQQYYIFEKLRITSTKLSENEANDTWQIRLFSNSGRVRLNIFCRFAQVKKYKTIFFYKTALFVDSYFL